MSPLDHILETYAVFELEVGEFTSELFKPWCSTCKEVCCKADYCQETQDSAFLSLIRRRHPTPASYSADHGWLTETGCALAVGRPPVCHEFLCKRILDSQPRPLGRYALNVLSKLVAHVGLRAAGRRHLVEILDSAGLAVIKTDAVDQRLSEARDAFQVVKFILAHKPVSEDGAACLSRIVRPPGAKDIWE